MAALFFPITAIASIFGINMPLGIETAPHWLGWGVLAIALASGIGTLWWVLSSRAAED
jgi:Mg2+ and Co2+ transporter CorA